MKYYKITLNKEKNGNLIYPENYQNEIGNYAVDHLYYDDADGVTKLLLLIEDKDATNIIRTNVVEITEAEVVTLSNTHEKRVEEVTDAAKIQRLALMSQMNQTFSADDLKATVIGDPKSAFAISLILADKIADLKAKESLKVPK